MSYQEIIEETRQSLLRQADPTGAERFEHQMADAVIESLTCRKPICSNHLSPDTLHTQGYCIDCFSEYWRRYA